MSRSDSAAARRRLARDTRGATAIEFSFVIGLIVMLVIGTIQVGRAIMLRNEISHALSQTVRMVHLNPGATRPQIEDHLRSLLNEDASLDVCVEPIQGTSVARILVVLPFELAIPFLPVRELALRLETIAPRITTEPTDTTDTCS